MIDSEKVIMELKAARLFFEMGSNHAYGFVGNLGCKSGMKYIDDAITLLKEQEPVSPIRMHHTEHKQTDNYKCGKCGYDMYFEQRFCELCGQAAKWE